MKIFTIKFILYFFYIYEFISYVMDYWYPSEQIVMTWEAIEPVAKKGNLIHLCHHSSVEG